MQRQKVGSFSRLFATLQPKFLPCRSGRSRGQLEATGRIFRQICLSFIPLIHPSLPSTLLSFTLQGLRRQRVQYTIKYILYSLKACDWTHMLHPNSGSDSFKVGITGPNKSINSAFVCPHLKDKPGVCAAKTFSGVKDGLSE